MKKFEYKVLDVIAKGFFGEKIDFQALNEKLDELGEEGWEVAAMEDTNIYEGASRSIVVILKEKNKYEKTNSCRQLENEFNLATGRNIIG